MFQFNNLTIKQFNNKGITLIEVLVVIAIILILLGVWVFNPRPSVDLDRAARQIVSDLRRAQNMAMSVQEQETCWEDPPGSGTNVCEIVVPCGYGIYIGYPGPPNLTLFSSYFNYDRYGDNCTTDNRTYGVYSVGWESEFFENLTYLSSNPLSIYFASPSGTTYLNGSNSGSQTIILQDSNGSTKTITITSAGRIEIQ